MDRPLVPGPWLRFEHMCEEEEEEEEDLFVFNDTIEGPRAPAVKPGLCFCVHLKVRG